MSEHPVGMTPQQVCSARNLKLGTPEFNKCVMELSRQSPDQMQTSIKDAGLPPAGQPSVGPMSDYPYTVPFLSKSEGYIRRMVTLRGNLAPVRHGEAYQFPRPAEVPEGATVSEAVKSCAFTDACPVNEGADVAEAVSCANSCRYSEQYGCPLYFLEETKIMGFGELKDIELFAAGVHKGRNFTNEDIDLIAANFGKFGEKVKPPMVLGHKDQDEQFLLNNSGLPAAGWLVEVRSVEKDGRKVLKGDFTDVPEVVKGAIQKRAFKRISAELYPNFMDDGKDQGLMVRRVGLLGADVPEVKDLADVVALHEIKGDPIFAFSEGDGNMPRPTNPPAPSGELDKLRIQLEEQKKNNAELTQEFARMRLQKDRESISAFCETLKRDGKMLPAWEELGIARFIENLDDSKTLKFADGNDAKAISPRAFLKNFLSSLPPVVRFEEVAAQDPSIRRTSSEPGKSNVGLAEEATKRVQEAAKANVTLSYTEAVKQAAAANPALVEG